MKSLPTLHVDVLRSRWAWWGTLAIYGTALPMPWLADLPLSVRVALVLATLLSLAWEWRERQRAYPTALRLLADGDWGVTFAAGADELVAQLQPGAYCYPWLIVLPLRLSSGESCRVLLWPDSAPPAQRRQLRAWLRWGFRQGEGEKESRV